MVGRLAEHLVLRQPIGQLREPNGVGIHIPRKPEPRMYGWCVEGPVLQPARSGHVRQLSELGPSELPSSP